MDALSIRHKEWRGHSYALNLRGAPEKMEPLYSYKNAPRHKRVHSLMQEYWVAFLASLAIKSNYSNRSFSGVFGKCEIKANASVTRDFSPMPLQR